MINTQERLRVHVKTQVILDILNERARQDEKFGTVEETNHTPTDWIAILTEELGEAAQAANNNRWSNGPIRSYREEMVQVAAVAVAALEDLLAREQAEAQANVLGAWPPPEGATE